MSRMYFNSLIARIEDVDPFGGNDVKVTIQDLNNKVLYENTYRHHVDAVAFIQTMSDDMLCGGITE
ncbi:MAG: hypothetical protein EPN88_13940 [Bacteroidetes bacterium]|nr:MAG: hypothetical protein EPN88_13940 [Bacteroidota bacterium]